jgi:hypothetical protein
MENLRERSPPVLVVEGKEAASITISASEALTNAATFLLRVLILALARRSLPDGFLRPASGVGDIVAAVAVKHPSLLSLGLLRQSKV